jgi:hypothetical protein
MFGISFYNLFRYTQSKIKKINSSKLREKKGYLKLINAQASQSTIETKVITFDIITALNLSHISMSCHLSQLIDVCTVLRVMVVGKIHKH